MENHGEKITECQEPMCDEEAAYNWNGMMVCKEHYFMYAEWEGFAPCAG
ncbi:MAG TPA: hypothetical protein VJI97_02850 [Candidatus Nanoarchaeia archaeon]|nr:hypothetical protein [Candidatus Nanoarchaeia archaeon]